MTRRRKPTTRRYSGFDLLKDVAFYLPGDDRITAPPGAPAARPLVSALENAPMIPDRYTDALIANLEDAHSHHPNPKGRSDWAGAIHLRAALLFQSLRYPSATTPADETNKLAYQLAADCCRMITALKLDPYFPPAPKE